MTPLTPTQKATLRFLRHQRVCTSRELADRAELDISTAKERLNTLVRLGLARKVPSHNVSEGKRPSFYWYEIINP